MMKKMMELMRNRGVNIEQTKQEITNSVQSDRQE